MRPLTYIRIVTAIIVNGRKTALMAMRLGATVGGLMKFDTTPGGGDRAGIPSTPAGSILDTWTTKLPGKTQTEPRYVKRSVEIRNKENVFKFLWNSGIK